MGSNAKKKTTMAKLNREHRTRERRMDKQMKKDARKSSEPAAASAAVPTENMPFGEDPLDRMALGSETFTPAEEASSRNS